MKMDKWLEEILPTVLADTFQYWMKNKLTGRDRAFEVFYLKDTIRNHLSTKITTRGFAMDVKVSNLMLELKTMGVINEVDSNTEIPADKMWELAAKYAAIHPPIYNHYQRLAPVHYAREVLYTAVHPDEYIYRLYKPGDYLECISVSRQTYHDSCVIRDHIEKHIGVSWMQILQDMGEEEVVDRIRQHVIKKFRESLPLRINDKATNKEEAPELTVKYLLKNIHLIDYDRLYKSST